MPDRSPPILYQAGLIEDERAFSNRVNQLGVASQLKPGTYELTGGSSLDTIIKQLEAGPGMLNALTIPEGSTRWGIAQAVDEATGGRISADDFLAATADASVYAEDYSFLASAGTNSLEGYLFPKTYDITADATAESVTRLMLDQFKTEIAGMQYSDLVANYSWYDIVKLASYHREGGPRRRSGARRRVRRVRQPPEQRGTGLQAAKRTPPPPTRWATIPPPRTCRPRSRTTPT